MERDADELVEVAKINGRFLPEILDRLERQVVGDALTLWAGYAAFCEECAGVSGEKLAAAILEPVAGQIAAMRERAGRLELEPDADTVEELREGLAEVWRTAEERGI